MHRHIVPLDIYHQLLLVPIDQRIELEDLASGAVFADQHGLLGRLLAVLGLIPALTRDPAVGGIEQGVVGPILAHLAAVLLFLLGIEEQILAVPLDHPLHIAALGLYNFDLAAVAPLYFRDKGVGLGMQAQGVERGEAQIQTLAHRHVDHRSAGVLETSIEYGAAREYLAGPAQQGRGGHPLQIELGDIAR